VTKQSWADKLKKRWNLKSGFQLFMVLLVFACTGFSVLFIKKPLFDLLGISGTSGWLYTILYLLAILPMYQALLLFYGFIFGQFKFFWQYEKRTFRRLFGKKKSQD
jgi:hypothetical protein